MESDPVDRTRDMLNAAGIEATTVTGICARLRAEFGGSECYIRKRDRGDIDRQIRKALEAGEAPVQVARATGLSPSTIRRRRSRWLR